MLAKYVIIDRPVLDWDDKTEDEGHTIDGSLFLLSGKGWDCMTWMMGL